MVRKRVCLCCALPFMSVFDTRWELPLSKTDLPRSVEDKHGIPFWLLVQTWPWETYLEKQTGVSMIDTSGLVPRAESYTVCSVSSSSAMVCQNIAACRLCWLSGGNLGSKRKGQVGTTEQALFSLLKEVTEGSKHKASTLEHHNQVRDSGAMGIIYQYKGNGSASHASMRRV